MLATTLVVQSGLITNEGNPMKIKYAIAVIGLIAAFALFTPTQANAQVSFGISVGTPYGYSYSCDPYSPYYDAYACGNYYAPGYVYAPSYGYGYYGGGYGRYWNHDHWAYRGAYGHGYRGNYGHSGYYNRGSYGHGNYGHSGSYAHNGGYGHSGGYGHGGGYSQGGGYGHGGGYSHGGGGFRGGSHGHR